MSGEAILATLHDPKGYENSSASVDVGRKGLARATNERIGEEGEGEGEGRELST